MDKETLNTYGWIIVAVLIGTIMLTMATPLGNFVFANIQSVTIKEIDNSNLGKEPNKVDAVDSQKRQSVVFQTNGGNFTGGYLTGYQPGTQVALPLNVTKEHYDFGGWFNNEALTGSPIQNIEHNQTGSLTYYAKWIPQKYTITYNLNGGQFMTNDTPRHYTYNQETQLPTAVSLGQVFKSGYTFDGWYLVSNDTHITTIAPGTHGNISVYAKWTPI